MRISRIAALAFCGGCVIRTVAVQPVARGPAHAPAPERPRTVLVERGGPAPAPAPGPADGIEALPGWQAADLNQWRDANTSEARYVDHAASGKLLLVRWKLEGKDKAVVTRTADLSLPAAGRLRFRTYSYVDHEVKLALGFFTGPDRTYYEAPIVKVPPKAWADHAIDLGVGYFKCAASNWNHTSPLGHPGELKELAVLVYDRGAGSLYVDALVVPGQ